MKTLLILSSLSFLAIGCGSNFPDLSSADSAVVETHTRVGGGDRVSSSDLSLIQIRALAVWLSSHGTGWTRKIEDTAPDIMIDFRRGGVGFGFMNIHPDFIQVGTNYRPLSSDEWIALQVILGNPGDDNPPQ
jgi:hypothetical protein